MTRLDRVLKLLADYDELVVTVNEETDQLDKCYSMARLNALRKERDVLVRELEEHGCRRKN